MRIYYIVNARMPNEKAHGIQIAKMCEALIEAGADLTLVVPRRGSPDLAVQEFYGLRVPVKTVYLPVVDLFARGRWWFALSSLTFMWSYLVWGSFNIRKGTVIYTCDIDTFSYCLFPLFKGEVFTEMHSGKKKDAWNGFFFRHVRGVFAINESTIASLQKAFLFDRSRCQIEPNGVDPKQFVMTDRETARSVVGFSGGKLSLYVGRALGWKSLEILVPAARLLPSDVTLGFLGATREEFIALTGKTDIPPQLQFFGSATFGDVPHWLSAADSLIVLGTKHNEDSYRYTSPMKLFEYMGSGRPIVASRTIALSEVVTDDEVLFYEPDDAASLAQKILESFDEKDRQTKAFEKGKYYTWQNRAQRILAFIGRAATL